MTPESRRRAALAAVALAAALFAACVVASWDKPIVGDLIVYPWWARAVLERGVPVAHFNPDEPPYPGNLHPPTYPYLLALGFRLLGERPRSAVAVNVACFAVMLALLAGLARRASASPLAPLVAVALVLVHPFAIQSVLLTDIDTTILPVAVVGYALAFLAVRDRLDARRTVALGLAFGLALWTKFTTPLALPAVTALFLAAEGRMRDAVRAGAGVAAVGLGFFAVTNLAYGAATGLDPFPMVGVASTKAREEVGKNVAALFAEVVSTLKTDLIWYGAPFAALVLAACLWRLAAAWRDRRPAAVDFPLALGLAVWAAYTLVIPTDGIPRYKSVSVPLLAVAVAGFLAHGLERSPLRRPALVAIFAWLGALLLYYLALPEIVLTATELAPTGDGTTKLLLMAAFVAPLPLLAVALVLGRRLPRARAAVAAAVVVFVAASVATDVKQAMAESPHNFFGIGQRGFRETVAWLERHARRDEIFLSYKDVPYYTRNRYYLYAVYGPEGRGVDLERIERILQRRDVAWWVLEDNPVRWRDARLDARLRGFIEARFELAARFGDFHIYKRRPGRAA